MKLTPEEMELIVNEDKEYLESTNTEVLEEECMGEEHMCSIVQQPFLRRGRYYAFKYLRNSEEWIFEDYPEVYEVTPVKRTITEYRRKK